MKVTVLMLKFSTGSLISMIYLILDVLMTSGYKIDVIYVDVDVASCLLNLSNVKTTRACINSYCSLRYFNLYTQCRICKLTTSVKASRKNPTANVLKFYLAFYFLTRLVYN